MQQVVHKVWDLWDEIASIMSLRRLPGEDNRTLRDRILNVGMYPEDSTRQGLVNAISSAMGYTQYNIRTRRIFVLTRMPHRASAFTVTVDAVLQNEMDEGSYSTAAVGYVVWKDEDGEFTRILEFLNPPGYSRDTTSRKHTGTKVEITYQYQDGDRIRTHTDKCHPYDEGDESYMGWYPEADGSVGVHTLNDVDWVDNPTNGWKHSDGTPTEQLKAVWREVDASMPSAWGK